MLLVPLGLPSLPAASPLHALRTPMAQGPAEEGLQAQVIVTNTGAWEEGAWRAGGQVFAGAGVCRGQVLAGAGCSPWQEPCVLVPVAVHTVLREPSRGAAMGTKPPHAEINSWTFWPGFRSTNLAGMRGN